MICPNILKNILKSYWKKLKRDIDIIDKYINVTELKAQKQTQ